MIRHLLSVAAWGQRRRAFVSIVGTLALAAGGAMAAPAAARADACCEERLCCARVCDCSLDCRAAVREGDQVWLVSTRRLGCARGACAVEPKLEVKRFTGGGWQGSSVSEFLAADVPTAENSALPITLFYIHGNRVERSEAVNDGWMVYHRMASSEAPPLKFVIFSWPSEQIRGPLRDVRAKAVRADSDAFYLGWLIDRIDPRIPVSLIGYSYGARIITGGLHVASGGRLAGAALVAPATAAGSRQVRVALLTAAIHRWWLYPGERHGLAMSQVDDMLVTYNPYDPVLKRYHVVEKRSQPVALGYTGFANCGRLGADASRVRQVNVSGAIGKSHDLRRYLCSDCLMARVRQEVLWMPIENASGEQLRHTVSR